MKMVIVNKANEGKKLFRYIRTLAPSMKNGEIFANIRKGKIKINNRIEDQDYILKDGDVVKIFFPDEIIKKYTDNDQNKYRSIDSNIDVIFEDKDIIVVNKPAGILVHPDKYEFKKTLVESVKAYLYKKNEFKPGDYFTPSPCHRLDTNTSGLIIFAKTHFGLQKITTLFRERASDKLYLALVYGKISSPILISSFIDSTENRENKVTVKDLQIHNFIPDKSKFIEENPNLSATYVKPLKYDSQRSLVEINLWTGKKHQIRACLAAANYPLLGEKKYYTYQSFSLSQLLNIADYYLHCYKLKINGYEEFKAPIPKEFSQKLSDMFKIDAAKL